MLSTAHCEKLMSVSVPISERARRYGYVVWPKKLDEDIKRLVAGQETIGVVFNDSDLGKKRIDWKYRRISVGPSRTRSITPTDNTFVLLLLDDGRLEVRTSRTTQ